MKKEAEWKEVTESIAEWNYAIFGVALGTLIIMYCRTFLKYAMTEVAGKMAGQIVFDILVPWGFAGLLIGLFIKVGNLHNRRRKIEKGDGNRG
ncbi:hypothetical protein [Bacillus thuringiensis]|uniref:hypothetical protein n=1 Tax=Bacillus thuringiensis TaxID=1428 RepID=UPI000BFDAE23|nr:hypothetical protein [Bacillus thuringiensis]PGT90152.1 hypothetical protein COD17_10415 [Bacillus thuringiensis]